MSKAPIPMSSDKAADSAAIDGKAIASKADLILHPVRLKILQALMGDRVLSTRQLSERLPDVPPATLYRHVQKLLQAKILTIAFEKPIRGTIERFYQLQEDNAELSPEDVSQLSCDDHQRYFTTFIATLLSDFDRYLQRDHIDLIEDGVGYRQMALNLTPEELSDLVQGLNAVLIPYLKHKPKRDRQRILFSTVLIPGD
jgi:DNA-binding transcriptional ArsR family regulator